MSGAPPLVFIGPSLPGPEVMRPLDGRIELRPPVRRGDIEGLDPRTRLVVIVDGVFFTQQAVSPREILAALRRGVRVIGSSSMGALRAAELDVFGMEGIGEVYRMYKSGEVSSDADVALTFDPDSGRATTEPIVNVLHMLKLATAEQVLGPAEARALLDLARRIYFFDLTYRALLHHARDVLPAETLDRLARFIEEHAGDGDLKRIDAQAALRRLGEILED